MFNVKHSEKVQDLVIDPGSAQGPYWEAQVFLTKVNVIVVALSKNVKDLLCGYRNKGNKNHLIQIFNLKVDKWTNMRTNKKAYKRPNGQRN